jgi:acetyl-CoA carboxylase carboxyl transferase subunit alpha
MGITAHKLLDLGLIDEVVPEPLGAAHRNPGDMYATLKQVLLKQLKQLQSIQPERLLSSRYDRLMSYGAPDHVYR